MMIRLPFSKVCLSLHFHGKQKYELPRPVISTIPLIQAIVHNDRRAASECLASGGDVNAQEWFGDTPLIVAANQGDANIAALLIDWGADVNLGTHYGTPLIEASRGGRHEVVKLLIERGADIHRASQDGSTPLHWAVLSGNREAVSALIAAGADPGAVNGARLTPTDIAEQRKYTTFRQRLLKRPDPEYIKMMQALGHMPVPE